MKVLVGMSGGVDSSVSAALLLEQGHEVVGGFIKNWSDSKDLWTGECQWRGERRDAIRVAAKLGIPLLTFDFEKEYRAAVIDELFRGYAAGETPNPDVLCNEFIKFGLFFDQMDKLGFDAVATGHYARVDQDEQGVAHLLMGKDAEKDQSYFLYRVSQSVLRRTLFPIGEFEKSHVRELAEKFALPVAQKPDSQGICFIGKLDMVEFLRKKIPSRPGEIVDDTGKVLGQHTGLDAYTIGQRERILVSQGAEAWYVAKKDVEQNRLVIVQGAEHPLLYTKEILVRDLHWTRGVVPKETFSCQVRTRYRQALVGARLEPHGEDQWLVTFEEPVKAVAAGQSAVFYEGEECLGGGVIVPS